MYRSLFSHPSLYPFSEEHRTSVGIRSPSGVNIAVSSKRRDDAPAPKPKAAAQNEPPPREPPNAELEAAIYAVQGLLMKPVYGSGSRVEVTTEGPATPSSNTSMTDIQRKLVRR